MGGRGSSSGGAGGVNSYSYFRQDMRAQVSAFENVLNSVDPNLITGFREYTYGYGGPLKDAHDTKYGLSDFIDSNLSDRLHVKNNPNLYRGGTISESELNALKPGDTLDIMDSKNQLTSWSDREVVAHMYAEESRSVWGQGGSTPKNVVIVDQSKTNDAMVMPYSYPANEVLRSKKMQYTVTKIVDDSQYSKPIGREREPSNDYYNSPVTYIYVKSKRR